MSMILQVGAVPLGFTPEVEGHYCDQCCEKDRRVFFSSAMSWQHLRSDSPLPDLIMGTTPPPSPHQQGGPHYKFFPSRTSPIDQNLDSFPLTPSPTPSGRECPNCRTQRGDEEEDHLKPKTKSDWSPEKVQLKLEHIQSVRRRLEEDMRSNLFFQSYSQRQQSLPQLSWGVPPPRRSQTRQRQADQRAEEQRDASATSTTVVQNASRGVSLDSEDWQFVEEEDTDRSLEWSLIGEDLRLMADSFQLHYASTVSSARASSVLPPTVPYAVAASLFFLFAWRLISRWR